MGTWLPSMEYIGRFTRVRKPRRFVTRVDQSQECVFWRVSDRAMHMSSHSWFQRKILLIRFLDLCFILLMFLFSFEKYGLRCRFYFFQSGLHTFYKKKSCGWIQSGDRKKRIGFTRENWASAWKTRWKVQKCWSWPLLFLIKKKSNLFYFHGALFLYFIIVRALLFWVLTRSKKLYCAENEPKNEKHMDLLSQESDDFSEEMSIPFK